jgi:hypothetical protein
LFATKACTVLKGIKAILKRLIKKGFIFMRSPSSDDKLALKNEELACLQRKPTFFMFYFGNNLE